jgi:hypothetical protein
MFYKNLITPDGEVVDTSNTTMEKPLNSLFSNLKVYDPSKDELGIDSLVRVKGERDSDIDPNLIKVAARGGSQQYTYKDKNGERVMKYIDTNGVVTYSKKENLASGGENNYEYDRNGVLLRKWFFDGIYTSQARTGTASDPTGTEVFNEDTLPTGTSNVPSLPKKEGKDLKPYIIGGILVLALLISIKK